MQRFFLIFSLVIVGLTAQTITQKAVKRFFKFADAAGLKAATANLNGARNVTLCRNQCTTFANSKQFIGAGVKPPSSDPLSKPAAAATACQNFCVHRASLKKYLDYQYGRLGNGKPFTANKAAQMKSVFIQADKTSNNNFTKTCEISMPKIMAQVPAEKQKLLKDTVTSITGAFYKSFPADAQNVFNYVY